MDESDIPVSNGGHQYSLKDVGSAEGLGNESSSVCSKLHQFVDEQLHCMDSAPRAFIAYAALWQEDMIHTSGTQLWVVQANGNAGT
jgi:hypothetical protein